MRSFTKPTAEVYTDEAPGYRGMPRDHYTVNHSKGEYGLTNGIESFWALLKRAYTGVYHKMSPKHLHRYVTEMQERHNRRPLTTLERMRSIVTDGVGKRLRYVDLIRRAEAEEIDQPKVAETSTAEVEAIRAALARIRAAMR